MISKYSIFIVALCTVFGFSAQAEFIDFDENYMVPEATYGKGLNICSEDNKVYDEFINFNILRHQHAELQDPHCFKKAIGDIPSDSEVAIRMGKISRKEGYPYSVNWGFIDAMQVSIVKGALNISLQFNGSRERSGEDNCFKDIDMELAEMSNYEAILCESFNFTITCPLQNQQDPCEPSDEEQ